MLTIRSALTFTLCCCVFITGCNSPNRTPTKAFRSEWISQWLTHNNPDCQPPCYSGVFPGQSTIREAEQLLEENIEITELEVVAPIPDIQNNWEISWKYINSTSGGRLTTEREGDTVNYIVLGFPSNSYVTIDEIITAYGPPSHVVIWTCGHGPCDIDIVYLEKGMGLRSLIPPDDKKNGIFQIKVSAQTEVRGVYFFEKGLEEFKHVIVGTSELSDQNFHLWEGYQLYSYSR